MPEAITVMAFDYGTRRIGIAIGNSLTQTSQALPVITQSQEGPRFEVFQMLLADWQPQRLAVGLPTHPDGAEHDNTVRARKFGRQLHGRFNLQVFEVDERYSTTEALSQGAKDADAASACIILNQFFAELP